ncbi:hypothetical protein D3C76_1505050 [compost metagenome]
MTEHAAALGGGFTHGLADDFVTGSAGLTGLADRTGCFTRLISQGLGTVFASLTQIPLNGLNLAPTVARRGLDAERYAQI